MVLPLPSKTSCVRLLADEGNQDLFVRELLKLFLDIFVVDILERDWFV